MSKKKLSRDYVGKFRHYRTVGPVVGGERILPTGGATVSICEIDGTTYAAVAYCHTNDAFNFQYGRAKADGRLKQLLGNKELVDDDKYFIRQGSAKELLRAVDSFMVNDMGYRANGAKA